MPFKKGQVGNPNGRPKGAKNKISYDVAEICDKNGCNPFEILAQIAAGTIDLPPEQKKYLGLRVRMEAANELAQYLAPKLKSVEVMTGDNQGFNFYFNSPPVEINQNEKIEEYAH